MKSKRSPKPARAVVGRPPIFPAEPPRARLTALALITFTVVFVALQVGSYTRTSATFDEPGGLAAGYAALASGDYRPALEHPPLTRLWAALPLLTMSGVSFDSKALDAARPEAVAFQGPFESGHRFLYAGNGDAANGDALLYRARFMNVLLGVVLGVLVYSWVAEWLGSPRRRRRARSLYDRAEHRRPLIARHDGPGRDVLHLRRALFSVAHVEATDDVEHRRARRLLRARDAEQVLGRDSWSGCARPPGDDGVAPRDLVGERGCWSRRAACGGHVAWRLGGIRFQIRSERNSRLAIRAPASPGRRARGADDCRARRVGRLASSPAECFQSGFLARSGSRTRTPVLPRRQLQQRRLVVLLPDRLPDQDATGSSGSLLRRRCLERQARAASSPSMARPSSSCRLSSSSRWR